jgi:putative nucleotidyltransferase with HDIG domain
MALTADLLEGIDHLDPLPITAQRLVKALDDERVGPAQIADYIEYDPAVASSVLKLANSAAWAGSIPTATVRDAVVRLGAARLLDIVLGEHMRGMRMRAPLYDLAENEIWIHSAAASLAVKALQRELPAGGIPDFASTAALVHDIGKLVMVRYMKADVSAILGLRNERDISFVEAERALFGCDHAEVGAEMARRWGFPTEIVHAIEHHHASPVQHPTPTLDAVVVANLVAKTIGTGLGAEGMDLKLDDRVDRRLRLDFAGFSRVSMQTLTWLKELKRAYGVSEQ